MPTLNEIIGSFFAHFLIFSSFCTFHLLNLWISDSVTGLKTNRSPALGTEERRGKLRLLFMFIATMFFFCYAILTPLCHNYFQSNLTFFFCSTVFITRNKHANEQNGMQRIYGIEFIKHKTEPIGSLVRLKQESRLQRRTGTWAVFG